MDDACVETSRRGVLVSTAATATLPASGVAHTQALPKAPVSMDGKVSLVANGKPDKLHPMQAAVTAQAFSGSRPTQDNAFKGPLATRTLAAMIAEGQAA